MQKSLKLKNDNKYKKFIKYILFGLIMGMTARYIPRCTLNNNELLIIAMIASISFGIIDMASPSIIVSSN